MIEILFSAYAQQPNHISMHLAHASPVTALQFGKTAQKHVKNAEMIKFKIIKECVYVHHRFHSMLETSVQNALMTSLCGMERPV